MFTLQDESEAAVILETRVNQLSTRLDTLGDVDLFASNQVINPIFPVVFSILTVLFIAVLVASRVCTDSKKAMAGARKVYLEYGALSRPNIVGGDEYVSRVCQEWASCCLSFSAHGWPAVSDTRLFYVGRCPCTTSCG